MIFPDEKTLKEKSISYRNLFAPLSRFSRDNLLLAYTSGWGDAINHIKSAASEGLEEWWSGARGEWEQVVAEAWQAAVISTAAKYEEKLREKDAEIDFAKKQVDLISQAANRVSEKTCQTKAENEQLKAAVKDLLSLAELVSACTNNDCKYDISAIRCAKKHADLITKINKGEK